MTPDMKRLCEAVGPAVEQTIIDAGNNRPPDLEAIVRAVLTELREIRPTSSEVERLEVAIQNEVGLDWQGDETWSVGFDDAARKVYDLGYRSIDHILAEPATA